MAASGRDRLKTERGMEYEIDTATRLAKCALKSDDYEGMKACHARLWHATESTSIKEGSELHQLLGVLEERIIQIDCQLHQENIRTMEHDTEDLDRQTQKSPSRSQNNQSILDTEKCKSEKLIKTSSHKSVCSSASDSVQKRLKIETAKLELCRLDQLEKLERQSVEVKLKSTELELKKARLNVEIEIQKDQMELDMMNDQFLCEDEKDCDSDEKICPKRNPELERRSAMSKTQDGVGKQQGEGHGSGHEDRESRYDGREPQSNSREPRHSEVHGPRSEVHEMQRERYTRRESLDITDRDWLLTRAIDRMSLAGHLDIKFAGSAKDKHTFVQFWLKFSTAYGSKTGLSDEEKLIKLSECTSDDAKNIVDSCLLLGSSGYKIAEERLKERYGKPEEIVMSVMKNLTQGPTVLLSDNFALVRLSDEIGACIDVLDRLTMESDYRTDFKAMAESVDNITRLLKRIPPNWRNDLISRSDVLGLSCIGRYLTRKTRNLTGAIALACSSTPKPSPPGNSGITGSGRFQRRVNSTLEDNSGAQSGCDFCEGTSHYLDTCKIFEKISPQERQKLLRIRKLCFNCFGHHLASECVEGSRCQLPCKWKSKHNALLHNLRPKVERSENTQSFTTRTSPDSGLELEGDSAIDEIELLDNQGDVREILEPVSEPEPDEMVASTSRGGRTSFQRPFFQVIPVVVTSPVTGKSVKTFGCLDSMSTVHCADGQLLKALELDLPVTKTVISTVTGTREIETRFCDLTVRGLYGISSHLLKSVEFIPGDHLRKTRIPQPDEVDRYEHLRFLKSQMQPLFLNQVSLLIGAGATHLHLARDVRVAADPSMPVAVRTDLGWCVFGGSESPIIDNDNRVNFIQRQSGMPPDDLSNDLDQLWRIEANELCAENGLSVQDREASSILQQSLRRTDSGQFEVSLLWKEGDPRFPNNIAHAERQLIQKRLKFIRNPEYLKKYAEQVNVYLSSGFARIVPQEQEKPEEGKLWYVTHHAVKHARKPSLRLVFNCSARYKNISLNDKLYPGPDLINLLVGVLVRFRTGGRYAVSADVKSMYHCVRVPPDQTSFLRWLWFENDDPRGKVVELEMLVHLFGCLSSSACANFALRQCAIEEGETIGRQIQRNFYVDDYLASFDSLEAARDTVPAVFQALGNGGFTLTKFCSTDKRILRDIPEEHCIAGSESGERVIQAQDQKFPEQVALGVRWDPNKDCIIFRALSIDLVCSKRGVLSAIARIIYDPCGLIMPVVVLPARILFQELCRRHADWDKPLEEEEEKHFRKWYTTVKDIGQVEINRCTRPGLTGKVVSCQLHFLSDASEKCLGSCCYLREVTETGEVSCTLIFAKSRLAPLHRTLTLVRLELQAAHTSVMIRNMILPQLEFEVDAVHYWVDSTAVLGYIANDEKRYQVFVANRIALIRKFSKVEDWHWISSGQNTSDIMTRGLQESERFDCNHRWFTGPDFLRRVDIQFPEPATGRRIPDDDLELRKQQSAFSLEADHQRSFTMDYLVKFSTWYKVKMAVAILFKFRQWALKEKSFERGISLSDLQFAGRLIIRMIQRECFQDEIKRVGQKVKLPKRSPIRKLCPFVGEDGLLRVGGRLTAVNGSYNFKHPMILPGKHHVTEMLIREFHAQSGHGSVKQIQNEMRMKFYVVGGRSAVHRVWVRCHQCRRQLAKPGEQFMSPLPEARLKPFEPAFTYCAVDLFGHYFVKIGRSMVKRWGVIFICENSKSVHIEIVHSMDMSSFLNALRRMCGRRGKPKQVRSDQGSNLRAADKEMSGMVKEWNESGIEGRLRQQGIKWIFTPPTGSHMNGLAERVIRSARGVLVHLIGEQILSEESLQTLFVECEWILNNRPIAELSSDPSDGRALTPAHLIQPRTDEIGLPPGLFSQDDNYAKKRWRQVQYLADMFWKRFVKEVYQLLQKRQKWLSERRNLKMDDLVLIVDPNLHRNDWRYGRVTRVNVSQDGLIRSCSVKTNGGNVLERPVTKLCLLEASG